VRREKENHSPTAIFLSQVVHRESTLLLHITVYSVWIFSFRDWLRLHT